MNYQLIFRSRFGQISAALVFAVGLIFLGMVWYSDGFVLMAKSAILPLGLTYFTWFIWGWPAVIVDQRGILVRNQIRTIKIGWDSFVRAKSSLGLYLYAITEKSTQEDPAAIFAAGVPAKGGLRAAGTQNAPVVPELFFDKGPRQVLPVEPIIAARMIDEEKFYQDNPGQRPHSRISPTAIDLPEPQTQDVGVTINYNWLQLGILAAFIAGAATLFVG